MVWPCGTKFLAEKIDQKIVIFGGHGDKKLHFFTKNGRNVTWMGSNGYIMHITYLNYVDISPAEPKKIDFQGVQNCKNDENRKNDDFLVDFSAKYFVPQGHTNFTGIIRLGFGHDGQVFGCTMGPHGTHSTPEYQAVIFKSW